MSRRVSPSMDRSYGVLRVTRVWGTSRATLYRHRGQPDTPPPRRRSGPLGPLPDEGLVEAIRELLGGQPVSHGEGHRKVWARLRFAGIRTSKRRVLRLMREHRLLRAEPGRAAPARSHDGTIRPARVDRCGAPT